MTLKKKLLAVTVVAALVPMAVASAVAYAVAHGALRDGVTARVTAIRDTTMHSIATMVDYRGDRATARARESGVAIALRELAEAYLALPRDLGWEGGAGDASGSSDAAAAARAVRERLVEPLRAALRGRDVAAGAVEALAPSAPAAVAVQALFANAADTPEGRRRVTRPEGDASSYGAAHARHHGHFLPLVEELGYRDVLLVDAASRTVVYSVAKEIDLGADLERGPLRQSGLGNAARRALEGGAGFVFEDFTPYLPSGGVPAAFLAAPIRDAGLVVGALVFQWPPDELDLVTATASGLGETGEVFLVGADHLNRVRLRHGNVPILSRNLESHAVNQALAGTAGTAEAPDYRGIDTLVAFAPLDVAGTRYSLVAKMDTEEAYAPIRTLLRWVTGLAVVLALLAGVTGLLVARSLSRPVQAVSERLQGLAGQMHSTSQEQQAGAAEQSAAVEETRQTFQGLLGATKDLSRIGTDVLGNAEISQRNAQAIGRRIHELTASTATIGEVLGLVKDIANKSEILALNAALEGTKAGEAGRGFSLVATQMQRLAEQVMGSAKKIEGLTREIGKTSQGAVLAAEEAEKVAAQTTEAARRIGAAVGMQQSGAEQVSTAMTEISQVAQRNVDAARQTVASANDLITLAESVRAALGGRR